MYVPIAHIHRIGDPMSTSKFKFIFNEAQNYITETLLSLVTERRTTASLVILNSICNRLISLVWEQTPEEKKVCSWLF